MRKRLDEVKNAEMLQEWMERRKEAKVNLALELRGDLTKSEERYLYMISLHYTVWVYYNITLYGIQVFSRSNQCQE